MFNALRSSGYFQLQHCGALIIVIALLITSISGCTQVRKKLEFETKAQIDFTAANDINPNTEGRPSPVVVKLFKLADSRQFKQQDFLALYENAKERLGVDLLEAVNLKEFAPNEHRTEQLKLTPDVKYIGILVEYSRYKEAQATMVLPIESYKANAYRVKLSHLNVRLQDKDEYQAPDETKYQVTNEEDEEDDF